MEKGDLFIETSDTKTIAATVTGVQAGLDREISPLILTPGKFRTLKTADPALCGRILAGKVQNDGSQ